MKDIYYTHTHIHIYTYSIFAHNGPSTIVTPRTHRTKTKVEQLTRPLQMAQRSGCMSGRGTMYNLPKYLFPFFGKFPSLTQTHRPRGSSSAAERSGEIVPQNAENLERESHFTHTDGHRSLYTLNKKGDTQVHHTGDDDHANQTVPPPRVAILRSSSSRRVTSGEKDNTKHTNTHTPAARHSAPVSAFFSRTLI